MRNLLKLTAAAAILATSFLASPAPVAASTCTNYCNWEYNQCINVWQFPQQECAIDRTHCLAHCV